jgi:hypothetical protein
MPRRKMTEEEKAERDRKKQVKHLKHLIERDLYDLRTRWNLPEPAYQHEVGDRIKYGNWQWTGILEKLDDGKIYKCFSISWKTNTNHFKPFHEMKIHYLAWYDAGFYKSNEEISAMERLEEEEDIRISYQQRDLISLLHYMDNEYGIDLEPEYQRGNVWKHRQKVALIDSIFKNIDIGKFTIIRRPWGKNPNKPITPKLYEMLDGKQRLTALHEYRMGRFKWKGKYFHELHPQDMNHFQYYNISYAETNENLTKEQKYRYFLKLNTGGTPVDEKHLDKVRKMWLDAKNDRNK